MEVGCDVPTDDYDEIDEVDDYDDYDDDEVEEVEDDIEEVDDIDDVEDKGRRQLRRGRLTEFSDRLAGGAARPGEESVRKSPFVMLMAGAIILLALIGLIFFVMIMSADEENTFNDAMNKLKAQAYPEAEIKLTKFLEAYPGGSFEDQARIALHTARVKKYTEASAYTVDAVKEGVTELEEMIRVCRDIEGFMDDEAKNVARYARRMTRVGAIVAEQKKDPKALEESKKAQKIFEQFAGDDIPLAVQNSLQQLQEKAEAAINKDGVLQKSVAEINGHLEAGDTFAALEARQVMLIDRYASLARDKDVMALLQKILDKEKELTVQESIGKDASTEELPASDVQAATLALRTQARTDLVSRGSRVFAVGLGSCFGLDSETGAPVWKRSV